MIDVATSRWFGLIVAITNTHNQNVDELPTSPARLLERYYKAKYKFVSPRSKFVYRIEFTDPHQETLFRLKYADYIV